MRIVRGIHGDMPVTIIESMNPVKHAIETTDRKTKKIIVITDTKLITHYCVKVFRTLIVGMVEGTLNKQENGIVRTFTLQADGLMYRLYHIHVTKVVISSFLLLQNRARFMQRQDDTAHITARCHNAP